MSKTVRIALAISCALMAVLLVATVTLTATLSVASSKNFYVRQFAKLEVSGQLDTSDADVARVRDHMLDYLFGGLDALPDDYITTSKGSIRFWNDSERAHMSDVKALMSAAGLARDIFAATILLGSAGLVFSLTLVYKRKKKDKDDSVMFRAYAARSVLTGTTIGCIILTASVVALAVAAAVDFDNTFELFHTVFFPQGNYSFFNTNMIKMLPAELFIAAAIYIIAAAAVSLAGIGVAAWFGLRRCRKNFL